MTEELLKRLVDIANERFDGHLTIMKFSTNWRVGFGTPWRNTAIKLMTWR